MLVICHCTFVGGEFLDDPPQEFDGFYHSAQVIFIIENFDNFVRLAWKRLCSPFLAVYVRKNRRKWKVSKLLLLLECNNPELTSYEANHVKISSMVLDLGCERNLGW